jgi:hypothetical protein
MERRREREKEREREREREREQAECGESEMARAPLLPSTPPFFYSSTLLLLLPTPALGMLASPPLSSSLR